MVRLFLPLSGEPPEELRVDGAKLHYLRLVLRLREVILSSSMGRALRFEASVTAMSDQEAVLKLGAAKAQKARRFIPAVVQGLPKGDKLELVIQKGTELGASAFAPAFTVAIRGDLGRSAAPRIARSVGKRSRRKRRGRADAPTSLRSFSRRAPRGGARGLWPD